MQQSLERCTRQASSSRFVGYNARGLGGIRLLGQAKSARVADSAHGERRRLRAAVIGPGVVVLAVDAGALVVSCPWLCPWLKRP